MHLIEADVEGTHELFELVTETDIAHQAVVGVDGDAETKPAQEFDGVPRDRCDGAGMDVRGRTHLQRHANVADETGQIAHVDVTVRSHLDVIDDADTVPQTLRPAPLQRFPYRG